MTTTTAPEATVTIPTGLTIGETFTHSVPKSWGVRYEFAEISFEGFWGREVIGVLVDGEPHDLCRRCGTGYGHYSWNGDDDICYDCAGEGYGKPASLEDQLRRANNRKKAAAKKEADRLAWVAAKEAALAAWKAANADLWTALQSFLPAMERDEYDGREYRRPATTFLAKLAVQVADEEKALTERQTAAAKDAVAKAQARHTERVEAGHWGTEGKRAEVEVTVVGCRSFESDYGTRWLVTMKTAEGAVLKTWTSGAFVDTAIDRHQDGAPVRIKATVKAHGAYNGLPETTVTRVAVA
jgi:ribosomal protein L37E